MWFLELGNQAVFGTEENMWFLELKKMGSF